MKPARDTPVIRLFSFAYSPFAAKVWKCLEMKGLAHEVVEVPYLDRRELVSITGGSIHVPVLVDGDQVVRESARITAYLDARYQPSLRPAGLGPAPVIFEQWSDLCVEDVAFRIATPGIDARIGELNGGRQDARALFRLIKERKFGAGCIEDWQARAPELYTRLRELLAPIALGLESTPFLLGAEPTVADAALFGNLWMIEWAEPGAVRAHLPGLRAWYERVLARRP